MIVFYFGFGVLEVDGIRQGDCSDRLTVEWELFFFEVFTACEKIYPVGDCSLCL
jgi:hypothetical protein